MSDIVICTVMKDEAPYILEWVAYYDLLGFDMIIADNGGSDGTSELLSALHDARIIRRLDYTWFKGPPQIPSYRAMVRLASRFGYEIMGFLDADEFFTRDFPVVRLSPANGADHIRDLFYSHNASQISFHWTCYGSRSEATSYERPVLERFSHHAGAEEPRNQWTKSFARVSEMMAAKDMLGIGPKIESAHFFAARRNWLIGGRSAKNHWKRPETTYDLGRILHFQIKSLSEYESRHKRGDVATTNNKYDRRYFEIHDYDDHVTKVAPEAIAALVARMSELRSQIATHSPSAASSAVTPEEARSLSRGISSVKWRKTLQKARNFMRKRI